MWFTDVCSKVWLLLWRVASNRSRSEEDSSLRRGSRRLRQSRHVTASTSLRFTTLRDQSRTKVIIRRNGRQQNPENRSSPRHRCCNVIQNDRVSLRLIRHFLAATTLTSGILLVPGSKTSIE